MAQPLSPERWQRLQDLFLENVDLSRPVQEASVQALAATDAPLAAELAGMLAAAAKASSRLSDVVQAGTARVASAAVDASGRRFGKYRTVREVGRGGMGVVYEAVGEDEFQQRVAVKVATFAGAGTALDERFVLERQILARLEHPNIARFIDGGAEHGHPYVVMELVDGVPLTTYCQARALPLEARIALVQRVCAAVQYAHQHLVVHRDLKPSNILVTSDGVPKLLDFGIATLLEPGRAQQATLGLVTWTPDYASPEQVTGQPVSTQSDVYSLGLVLYEVLTGVRAQRAAASSPLALTRSVVETVPPAPSAAAAGAGHAALARRLRGDLDTVVLTAVAKEPSQRYGSAAALADDLERALDGLPIHARPSTRWYRARRFAVRHRVAVISAAAVVVALIAGSVATAYQARRAERRFQQVRALANAFVFDVHDLIAPLPGATEARRRIVQTALTYLENLREDAAGDATLATEIAAAYDRVGTVQGHPLSSNLGDTDAALDSYDRAQALLEPLAARGDPAADALLAVVLQHVADIRRAKGQREAATAAAARARDIGERALATAPNDRRLLAALGESYADLARSATELRDAATAVRAAERAMAIAERDVALAPADRAAKNNLATALNAAGAARLAAGRLEAAAESFRRGVDVREALVHEAPDNADLRRALMVSYGNLGDLLGGRLGQNLGDMEGAAAAFRQAVDLARAALADDPVDRRARFDVVNAELRVGALLADAEVNLDEAHAHLLEADRLNAGLLREEPGSDRYGFVQLVLDRRLGAVLAALGQHREAMARLGRVVSAAPRFATGPNRANARQQMVLSLARLAALQAATAEPGALAVAGRVADELRSAPLTPPAMAAPVLTTVADAYLTLAGRTAAAARRPLLASARDFLDRAEAAWKTAAMPATLETRRAGALEGISAARARADILDRP